MNKLDGAIKLSEDLYETAVSRYLDKTDFNYSEWLDEDEIERYEAAMRIVEA